AEEEMEGNKNHKKILEELEPEEKHEEELEEKNIEYDQTGWEIIKLNEILPNPKGKDEEMEYIELINNTPTDMDLKHWKLINNKQKKIYVFGKDVDSRLRANGVLLLRPL